MQRSLAALLLVATTLAGCAGGDSSAAERLEELGFFDYARGDARDAAIAEVRAEPDVGVFSEHTHRFHFADAEDLAEGGVGTFLRELQPLLRELGVPSLRIREEFEPHGYRVWVNGTAHTIYGANELESDIFWGYAAGRTAQIVNGLLRRSGSDERAYGYADPASNDFSIFILTPKLRDAVAEIVDGTRHDPFAVTDDPPSFGYAHWREGFGSG